METWLSTDLLTAISGRSFPKVVGVKRKKRHKTIPTTVAMSATDVTGSMNLNIRSIPPSVS
jgi:hypothetical protein